jgi:glyceraldehyde-3-phosphate dehydrogenase type I
VTLISNQEFDDAISLAEQLIPLIGSLYRNQGVVLSIHGRSLINRTPIELVKAHRYARHVDGHPLEINRSYKLIRLLCDLDLAPASIDVARLLAKTGGDDARLESLIRSELASVISGGKAAPAVERDVVLYGFGRIGRLVARILLSHAGARGGLRLRAIVVRKGSDDDLTKRASLLRRDSVHGPFEGTIVADYENDTIVANGTAIRVIYSDDPANIDYTAYGIHDALIIDNTGKWRDEAGLARHLESSGAAKVLLTAPGKGSLPNVVFGINHSEITADARIVTAASCTTNAITPVLKVLDDAFGVGHGHVETVHSFTNDQNLIDNFHKGERRGRSAALNMVITETGAASAVAKALPQFAGKLTGNSIRVPTPDVSLAILNLDFGRDVTALEVNQVLREASLGSPLRNQIDFIESPEVVSTDFVGSNRAGIVDGLATKAGGSHGVIYVWYDNENGYSHQVVRVAEAMGVPKRPVFPPH